jgi:hypothetical protein
LLRRWLRLACRGISHLLLRISLSHVKVRIRLILLLVVIILITQQIVLLGIKAVLLRNFIWLKKEAINTAADTNISELRYFFASYTATRILTWPVARRCSISTF